LVAGSGGGLDAGPKLARVALPLLGHCSFAEVQVGPYILPALPYGHGALEPHLWGTVIEAHHRAIHRHLVDDANAHFVGLLEARKALGPDALEARESSLAYNLSGHVLHSIFWQNLSPAGGGRPDGALALAIDRDFGAFDNFKRVMVQAACDVRGSGWAALAWDAAGLRLVTRTIKDHDLGAMQGSSMLMLIDAWEHAYFGQYRADKGRYFEALWKLWNWDDIQARLERAKQLEGEPQPAAAH
jgi:Fe-Mn family superoxide dismutase